CLEHALIAQANDHTPFHFRVTKPGSVFCIKRLFPAIIEWRIRIGCWNKRYLLNQRAATRRILFILLSDILIQPQARVYPFSVVKQLRTCRFLHELLIDLLKAMTICWFRLITHERASVSSASPASTLRMD